MLTHLNFDGMNRRARKPILLQLSRRARLLNCGWIGTWGFTYEQWAYVACDIANNLRRGLQHPAQAEARFKQSIANHQLWALEDGGRQLFYLE